MSFILDALRRAETERARGAVPGLEARALPLAGDDEPSRAAPTRGPWIVAGLAAGALVLGLAGWWLTRAPADTASVASTAPPATPETPASPGTPAPNALTAPAAPPAALAPPARPAPASALLPPAIPASPAPTLPSPLAAAQRTATPTASRQAASTAVTSTAAASATANAATAPRSATSASGATDGRVVPLAQLSPQQRAELPPMAIGGAIYSDSPASRFILLNGQVLREGELAAPGVTLERIGPRSAVIRWRGQLVEIPL